MAVPVEDLGQVEYPSAGGGQFQRQRQAAEAAHQLGQYRQLGGLDRVAAHVPQPFQEQ